MTGERLSVLGDHRRVNTARTLLDDFARRTGVDGPEPPRRYLWTDAFAVGVDLGLYRHTGDGAHLDRARRLVNQVHRVLGRHRDDDERAGWISGLGEAEGEDHPTAGGLRIGKERPERRPGEPRDPALEWERDGQYYHYLTRWMHALSRMAGETGETRYLRWAVELAGAAHRGFFRRAGPGGPLRIHWKMSIDLSRPLVESQGAHDPLDGFTTLVALRAAARGRAGESVRGDTPGDAPGEAPTEVSREASVEALGDVLDAPIAELRELCRGRSWATDDPLGIGGLLLDLHEWAGLAAGALEEAPRWMGRLADDAETSLEAWSARRPLAAPVDRRLPFRELGLALGLEAVAGLLNVGGAHPEAAGPPPFPLAPLAELGRRVPLGREVEAFWMEPAHRGVRTWLDHRDINDVTLAASLVPGGWLGDGASGLRRARRGGP